MHAVRLKALVIILVMGVVYGGVIFGSAGRLDLPMFWIVLAVWMAGAVTMSLTISADLLQERIRPGPGVRERWFRPVLIALNLGHLITAGADAGRLHLSDTVPPALQVVGVAGIVAMFGVALWAMTANPFFSSVVRIQHDRGHHVVSSGPYRFVRHPAYAVFMTMQLWSGLALGSWLSLVFVPAVAAVCVGRTVIEDRALQAELPGYDEYAGRVRWRLVPGVW